MSLAVELIECSAKAIETSRESMQICGGGGYSAREGVIEVRRRPPEDLEDTLLIAKAHSPVELPRENLRSANRHTQIVDHLVSEAFVGTKKAPSQ